MEGLKLNIVIRNLRNNSENIETVRFPCDEEILDKICDSLGIKMTTESNCYILDSSDKDFLRIIPDNLCNIDELNYLMKRLDGFSPREIKQFYATAFAEEPKTKAELINLSFNMHCYSLVTDFNNLNRIGKDLYLSERQAVASKEFDELDGEAFAMKVIRETSNSIVTPYGVLYKNSNEPEQVYNGKQFPPYEWKDTMATVELKVKGESEYIYTLF